MLIFVRLAKDGAARAFEKMELDASFVSMTSAKTRL